MSTVTFFPSTTPADGAENCGPWFGTTTVGNRPPVITCSLARADGSSLNYLRIYVNGVEIYGRGTGSRGGTEPGWSEAEEGIAGPPLGYRWDRVILSHNVPDAQGEEFEIEVIGSTFLNGFDPGSIAWSFTTGEFGDLNQIVNGLTLDEVSTRLEEICGQGTTTPPVISDVTPTPGEQIGANDALGFRVTDADGYQTLVVWAQMASNWEMIYSDSDGFGPLYLGSTRTVEVVGQQYLFSVRRTGGWPSAPTLHVEPVDIYGAEPENP